MEIRKLKEEEYGEFKQGIKEAFQYGFERYFGKCESTIIPDEDIMSSYRTRGSHSFVAAKNGEIVGGCIVVVDEFSGIGELHILYVKIGLQRKGIGYLIWRKVENEFPCVRTWKTCTPYFDQRNIYFYVNKCGFHVTRYIRDLKDDGFIGDVGGGMFEFEKEMTRG